MLYLPDAQALQVQALLARGVYEEVDVLDLETCFDVVGVFDLQVERDASFVADGFVVHNSAVCRFMHGREFTVARAMQRFDDVERANDPAQIADLQPWMRTGADDDGHQVLFYERDGRRHLVARVDASDVGTADRTGRYSRALTNDQLEAAGLMTPPLHGRCRSTLVSVS